MPAPWHSSTAILADLKPHRDYVDGAWQAAKAAPLSRRKALLAAMLMDTYVDHLFLAMPEPDDILRFRSQLAERSPELGAIMALAAQQDGVRLVIEAVAVPIADYCALSTADFMVSLYNGHSVQRVQLVLQDGSRRDMLELLAGAMDAIALAESEV